MQCGNLLWENMYLSGGVALKFFSDHASYPLFNNILVNITTLKKGVRT